jgi:hypothetical protein
VRTRDDAEEFAVIWAIMILLCIPLWLIAIALLSLFRVRGTVRQIPGFFDCKVRRAATAGKEPEQFTRNTGRAHWVHDVLVLHSGNPFLIVTTPYGVTEVVDGTLPADSESRL